MSRATLASTIRAAVLLFTAGCFGCPSPEPPCCDPLPVGSLEILPWKVTVVKDGIFTMRARLKDEYGNTLPDSRADQVKWKGTGGLDVPAAPTGAVSVTANPGAATLPLATQLIASIDGLTATAPVTIVAHASPSSGDDWIIGEYANMDAPSIALLNGSGTEGGAPVTVNGDMFAFVHEAGFSGLDCPAADNCGEVAVFSAHHAPSHRTVRWSSGCDIVKGATAGLPTSCSPVQEIGGSLAPLKPPITIQVTVWNASITLISDVNDDINYARGVFSAPWIGLNLDIKPPTQVSPSTVAYNDALGCYTGGPTDIAGQLPQVPAATYQPDHITVLYVDDINPGDGTIAGFTCKYDPAKGTLIVLGAGRADGSTKLAHELGHALGQWRPPAPIHPDAWSPALTTIDPSNLLWSAEVDGGGGPRRFLTLGQIFQMAFNAASFANTAPGTSLGQTITCNTDPTTNSPCPPLAKDVTK